MQAYSDVAEQAYDLIGLFLAASSLLHDARLFVELAQLFERRGWSSMAKETLQRAAGRLVYATLLIDAAADLN
jgi:hypothetical protein